MKKLFFLLCLLPIVAIAQPGYITTIVGNGSIGYSGDGGPATAASIGTVSGCAVDLRGNLYFPDYDNSVIRKVNPAGIVTTFAGGGSSTADGITATSASLNLNTSGAIAVDAAGNVIFPESYRIRKVNVTTGIITTIAGTTTSGFSGDGGPATAATFASIHGVHVTNAGELYITDAGNERVRKVNLSGIITTVAGTGTAGFSGDGGPATSAQLSYPSQVCEDWMGNLYIADYWNGRIRKVNRAGIITTFAGGGSGYYGAPATSVYLHEPSGVCVDNIGNLYISEFHGGGVGIINPSGIINWFAGSGSSYVDGIPATSASLVPAMTVSIDNYNNIYIPQQSRYRLRKVESNMPTIVSDSFSAFVSYLCGGPSIMITPYHYLPSLHVETTFGDGVSQSDTFSHFSGCAYANHTYPTSGTYIIKHVVFNGSIAIDSVSYSNEYKRCATIPVKIYHDRDGNCMKDTNEYAFLKPIDIAVDSNGITIDTISCLSGLYYNAFGVPGDVYAFRVISAPHGVSTSCPSSGSISDTLTSGIYSIHDHVFGFSCDTIHAFDLGTHFSVGGTGRHTQIGNIYAYNSYCPHTNATVTLYHSPKYAYHSASPTPSSTTATTITWNLANLTSADDPTHLYYHIEVPSTYLTPGDTVNSIVTIAPGTGDADTSNNVVIRNDTVRSSYDPNFIESTPSGHILAGSTLRYTVGFENDGNDTAHNIYVLDTLSGDMEAATLKPVFASHEMYIEKLTGTGGLAVYKFDFPNIKLLDSTHHGLCEGTFQYDIKVKNGLPDCTPIAARVGIYFDDNPVVMTNTFTNIIGCWPASVDNLPSAVSSPVVYPNPAYDVLNINADKQVYDTYTITNSVGVLVATDKLSAHTQVNIKQLPAGVYFVNLKGAGGNVVKKFVKM